MFFFHGLLNLLLFTFFFEQQSKKSTTKRQQLAEITTQSGFIDNKRARKLSGNSSFLCNVVGSQLDNFTTTKASAAEAFNDDDKMDADFYEYCSQYPLDKDCDDMVSGSENEARMEGLQEGLFPISETNYIFQEVYTFHMQEERPMKLLKEDVSWRLSTCEQLLQDKRMHKIMVAESYQHINKQDYIPDRREAKKCVIYEKEHVN
jgi:hypothetical protein